jgi:hypothetical protein
MPAPDKQSNKELTETEKLVISMLPFKTDNSKARYIGYRASGFTPREARQLVGVSPRSVRRWRQEDPDFVKAENNLVDLRKSLGVEYAHLEFLRNYRLILQKDFDVITKSLNPGKAGSMSKEDNQYLLKARGHYTPQQLEILQQLIGAAEKGGDVFNFTQFVTQWQNRVKDNEVRVDEVNSVTEAEFHEVGDNGEDDEEDGQSLLPSLPEFDGPD